jgi:hypothetical protein
MSTISYAETWHTFTVLSDTEMDSILSALELLSEQEYIDDWFVREAGEKYLILVQTSLHWKEAGERIVLELSGTTAEKVEKGWRS